MQQDVQGRLALDVLRSAGPLMSHELTHSDILYQGRILTLRLDRVRYPDGKEHTFEVIDHRDAVTILPIDAQGRVLFVRQYRQPAGRALLELPAGVAEAGEAVETSAQRELREETGMAANRLERLGGFFLAPGYTTEFMHVFLASELYPSPLPGDEDESIQLERLPLEAALQLAETGGIEDSKSLVALLWARRRL
ncbi:MAG: NUDIX hydrolase [Chloroflexota bacterium]